MKLVLHWTQRNSLNQQQAELTTRVMRVSAERHSVVNSDAFTY